MPSQTQTWSLSLLTCATLWVPFSHNSTAFFYWLPLCHNHIQVSPVLNLIFSFKLWPYSPKILDERVCTRMPNSPIPQPPLFGTILYEEGHRLKPGQAMADGRPWHGEGEPHSTHCLYLPTTHSPLNFLHPSFQWDASGYIHRHFSFIFLYPPTAHFLPLVSLFSLPGHSSPSPPTALLPSSLLHCRGAPRLSLLLSSTSAHSLLRNWFTLSMPLHGSQADILRKNVSDKF